MTRKSFGDQSVRIAIGKGSSRKVRKQMIEVLSSLSLATYAEDNPDLIIVEQEDGTWELVRPRGMSEYISGITSANEWKSLKTALTHYAQARFITNLNLNEPDLQVKVELIPIKMANKKFVSTIPIEEKMNNGVLEFTEGDYARIKVTNTGSVDCYYTIIDIQPDGVINPVVPNPYKNEPAKKYFIKAGQSYVIAKKFLQFAPPYGKETYKIILSTEEINIAPIVMTKGANARGALKTEIEKLFHSSYTLSRGTPVGTLDNDAALTTYNIIFKIKSQTK